MCLEYILSVLELDTHEAYIVLSEFLQGGGVIGAFNLDMIVEGNASFRHSYTPKV